jgi:hypothetical protein
MIKDKKDDAGSAVAQNEAMLEPSNTNSSYLPNRRTMLQLAAGAFGGIATGLVVKSIRESLLKERTIEQYGTLSNPRFLVREGLLPHEPQTYRDQLFNRQKDIPERLFQRTMKELDGIENALEQSNELIKRPKLANPTTSTRSTSELIAEIDKILSNKKEHTNANPEPDAENLLLVAETKLEVLKTELATVKISLGAGEISHSMKSVVNSFVSSIAHNDTHLKLIDQFGDPESFTRDFIHRMTGEKLPEGATFEVRKIDKEGVAGYSQFVQQKIVSKDAHYGGVFLINCHEAGHLMAQHQENDIFSKADSNNSSAVANWEEASAYAFEGVGSASIDDEALAIARTMFASDKLALLEEFYTGQNNEECHRVGMAYFDAALTVTGSVAKAYNYLASHNELTDEMKVVISNNLKHRKNLDQETPPQLQLIEERVSKCEKKLEDLKLTLGENSEAE